LVLFLFSKGRKMPGLLLKSPRGEKDAKKIVQEANNLKKLKECLNGWEYEETIPRLFDMTSDGKNTYLVMGVLKGILMAHYLRCPVKKAFTRENLLIQSVLNWLIQFHKKTWQTKVTVNRYIQDYLSPLIEKNIDRMTPHLENVWESATERLNKMGNESIPITLCHTDFNPYNI
ncbi:MAG: hypothetical protein KKH94_13820, partial [Candidatus Omnitrophica bacterium]|nr:hypothetical protein [Candidatus Omnitrophota bacterium]